MKTHCSNVARKAPPHQAAIVLLLAVALCSAGCTSFREYVHNGFKVGPNYCPPAAPVAVNWIDASTDARVSNSRDDLAGWWTVLGDPPLNGLIERAYGQNLTLREAGFRILAARAQLGFAVGNVFPQQQTATGSYTRFGLGNNFFDQWSLGFNLGWELDFWGRFRRAVDAAEATLDASVENYDAVLVTLLADVSNNYVTYRTAQERIRLLQNTIDVQEDVLTFIAGQVAEGVAGFTSIDEAQANANLNQSRAALNDLDVQLRQAQNNLCILMGMPVADLTPLLAGDGETTIPVAPKTLVVGVPADLLRRRPDVRRAEREAAAQAEQIGIAEADLYPAFTLSGTLGWQAANFSDLFNSDSLAASVGPGFRWNLLNYGRIRNNVLFQEAQFQALVAIYQNSVLQADLEVENGIVSFLNTQQRAEYLQTSVEDSALALQIAIEQYEAGAVDFNRYTVLLQSLIQQQDLWAQSRGQIVQSLIEVYRALGGGWQIRLGDVPDKRGVLSPADEALQQPEAVAGEPVADEVPAPLPAPGE
jgi:NodT family efflux transporter outer membrane factor (OMF) lipoprotein